MERSLPSTTYLTAEAWLAEKNAILRRDWFCAARGEDLPNPGDHVTLEIAGESVLLVRTKAGVLRAHYNVCRHRGARMCDAGNDAKWGLTLTGGVVGGIIRCPYHGWAYGLDGTLLAAPNLADAEDFDKSAFTLYPVGVTEWGGFVFLNLRPEDAPDIAEMLADASRRLANYPLDALHTARSIRYEVAANWKLLLENYNECYHCGPVHPELCAIVPEFRREGGIHLDWERGIPHREGATTYTMSGAPFLA